MFNVSFDIYLKLQVWTSSDLEFFEKFLASLSEYIYHIYKYVEVELRFYKT